LLLPAIQETTMGAWGEGLYSGDFAMDLRGAVKSVSRLPFDGDKLVEFLCGIEPGAAHRAEDEDHTTFWLVVADQFAKLGIVSQRAREKAMQIIDEGSDIAMLTRLGMDTSGLKKRQKMLADLRRSLTATQLPMKRRHQGGSATSDGRRRRFRLSHVSRTL
jgi:hypothetical protein